ncbi:hypothetical protein [Glutamicibacter arilaitensis]|uniref:hypothetical protein n=1 Tax=Glutamicibacter arilaitensis TaxID=256701 RepID=UPI003F8F4134
MYRVSSNRPDRGPLAPRPLDYKPFDDRKGWSRFDVGPASAAAGPGLTIYGATRRDTAFVEVLAWKSAPSATYSKLVEEAMFTGSSIDELLGDLHGLGIPVGGVTRDWRLEREIYTLETEVCRWVDLTNRRSISALRALIGSWYSGPVTSSVVTGDQREVTTRIAEVLRASSLVRPDGSKSTASGIKYGSKFGTIGSDDHCWAQWLVANNTGATITHSEPMDPTDPDVIEAVKHTGCFVP